MIEVFPFAGLPVAVFGLGRSGLSAARGLAAGEAEVWAWDDDDDVRAEAEKADVPLVNLYECDWKKLSTLVLSPGVRLNFPEPHPVVSLARAADCEVISDVELLARSQRDASYIGITGTNGKSTTTTLIGHIMQVSGKEAEIGGNLGIPALDLFPLGAEETYILEMSSYQLELTSSITFDVAVLLNISPDHLDRHGGLDRYIGVKKTIFNRQTPPRTAVVGVDDDHSRAVFEGLKAAGEQVVIPVSGDTPTPGGVYVSDGVLYDATEKGDPVPVTGVSAIATLPGVHNHQNAAAAYAATKVVGVPPRTIMACLQSYPGLAHRQELVAIVDGVTYVNDSKATNADAAARALACYDTVYWIAGGQAKEGGIGPLMPLAGRIRHAFLIGEAAQSMAEELAMAGERDGAVPVSHSGDLATALAAARALALSEGAADPAVLLSPACASFDQFEDFEARGDAFRDLVEALPGERTEPGE